MSSAARERALGAYLRPGVGRQRLLKLMSDGHGLSKHERELGHPSAAAYRRRVGRHLDRASSAHEVTTPDQPSRFLLVDARRNRVAWINPARLDRSTFFQPTNGARAYVDYLRDTRPDDRWRAVDIDRARSNGRVPATRTASTAHARRGGHERS